MKRDQLDPSTDVGEVLTWKRNGRSGDSYWRCLDCERPFLTEVEAERHLNAPMTETKHAARTGVAEFRLNAPHIGKATGMNVWPSDAGGANYDNRSELKLAGLKEGVDFRLPPPPEPKTVEPIVGEQTGPLVDADDQRADDHALIRELRQQVRRLRSQAQEAIAARDREHDTLQQEIRRSQGLHDEITRQAKVIEEANEETAALRATVVEQAGELKRLRGARVEEDDVVDVDMLPDHLRTAVHKLREHLDYKPLMLKGNEPAALTGEAMAWLLADVIGAGPDGQYAIWAYTGDVYRSPRGEIDDDTGVIIPGTRKVEA